jgi:ABC-type multidrug transport system ATPase subunit
MLYDSLSARENLRFAGRLHGVDRLEARVDELLERLDLAGRRDDPVGTFSRGMQQRVALARALLHEPLLLLLDEPFTGLDRRAAEALQELVQGARRRDRTILLVTHDVARGLALADRAVVLAAGRVAFDRRLTDAASRAAFDEEYAAFVLGGRPAGGEEVA